MSIGWSRDASSERYIELHDRGLAEMMHFTEPPASADWSLLSRLTRGRLTLGLWSVAAIVEIAIDYAGGATVATVARVLVTYGFGYVLSLAAVHLPTRRVTGAAHFSFVRMLAVAVPSGIALFIVDVVGRAFEHGPSPLDAWPIDFLLRTRVNCAYFIVLFVFESTVAWLTASAQALALRDRQLMEAQVAALRLQLNPHFLFNTLNSIATQASEAGARDAEFMIMRLSEFLRGTLATDPTMLVPVAVELSTVGAYIDIEAVRFGERLRIEYVCEPGLSEALVPHFMLQPLVENAIKHSVARSPEPVTVSIETTTADGGVLVLHVRDDGRFASGATSGGTGVGLRNIAARLEAIYGPAGTIETCGGGGTGFVVTIRLPLTLRIEEGVPRGGLSRLDSSEGSDAHPRLNEQDGATRASKGRSRRRPPAEA